METAMEHYERLTYDQECELSEKAKNGDIEAQNKMVMCNEGIVVRVACKFDGSWVPRNDLIQEGMISLIESVKSFDPSMGFRFSTHAQQNVYWSIYNCVNPKSKYGRPPQTINQDIIDEIPSNINYDYIDIKDEAFSVLKKFWPEDREMISLYFGLNGNDPLNQKQIAEYYGVSKSLINYKLSTAIEFVRNPPKLLVKTPKTDQVKRIQTKKRKFGEKYHTCNECGKNLFRSKRCFDCNPLKKNTCIQCKKEKPIDEFYRYASMKSGFSNRCKLCTQLYNKLSLINRKRRQSEKEQQQCQPSHA